MLCCVFDGPNLQDSSYPVASSTNDGDDDNDDDYIRRAKCAYLGIAKMLQNITTGVQFTLWIRTVTTCFLLEWRAFRGFSHPFIYRPPPPGVGKGRRSRALLEKPPDSADYLPYCRCWLIGWSTDTRCWSGRFRVISRCVRWCVVAVLWPLGIIESTAGR